MHFGLGKSLSARLGAWTLIIAAVSMLASSAEAVRIKEICDVQGARSNMLKGIGLVVGLASTGDKTAASIIAQQRVLERLGIEVKDVKELKPDNVAVVIVTANIPAFAKEGTQIDVNINSVYNCKSLEGGTLLETHLTGPGQGDTVYAVAQGPVSVGGFNASASGGGGGAKVQKNHVTAGRIPMGAHIEREVPSNITDGERMMLLVKKPDFDTASKIKEAIDTAMGEGAATAMGAGSVRVTIPEKDLTDLTSFVARLQELEVKTQMPSRVVINERTGTIVVGGNVGVKPCQVAHGNLTIKISQTPQVTPALPFTDAQPVVTATTKVEAKEEEAYFMPVEGTSAGDVAATLNRLRVTPRDMISIFQALREAGALEADLEIM